MASRARRRIIRARSRAFVLSRASSAFHPRKLITTLRKAAREELMKHMELKYGWLPAPPLEIQSNGTRTNKWEECARSSKGKRDADTRQGVGGGITVGIRSALALKETKWAREKAKGQQQRHGDETEQSFRARARSAISLARASASTLSLSLSSRPSIFFASWERARIGIYTYTYTPVSLSISSPTTGAHYLSRANAPRPHYISPRERERERERERGCSSPLGAKTTTSASGFRCCLSPRARELYPILYILLLLSPFFV